MTLLYGLGNNDPKYLQTKHNVGRLVVEKLASLLDLNFKNNSTNLVANNPDFILAYPDGYMNLVGKNLQQLISFFKLDIQNNNLIILQDDSDQIEGSFKLSLGGRSGGHKGLDSIHLETFKKLEIDKIWRLKIGIRPVENKSKSETFVLKRLSQADQNTLEYLAKIIFENQTLLINSELDKLQMLVNTKRQ